MEQRPLNTELPVLKEKSPASRPPPWSPRLEFTTDILKPKEELLRWILTYASDADVKWFYAQVMSKHRAVIQEALDSSEVASLNQQRDGLSSPVAPIQIELTNMSDSDDERLAPVVQQKSSSLPATGVRGAAMLEDFRTSGSMPPIVQFSCAMYFCSLDDEDSISLDVIRIGDLSKASEVSFVTVDASAMAGEKFVHASGRVTIAAGSNGEEIKINLIKSVRWDTTTEFKVMLHEEPAAENCTLGRYLYVCRVKVIDGNCFPTNKHREAIKNGELASVPFWGLLMEYFKLNSSDPVIRKGTRKMILLDSAHNIYFLLKLYLNVFMVDVIIKQALNKDNAWWMSTLDNELMLFLTIAILLVVPFGFLHILDFCETTWKVGGASRAMLQNALLRKFLNYAEHVRADLQSADLIMAMTRDVPKVVHEGYIKMLDLTRSATRLFMILIFQLTAPFMFPDGKLNPFGFGVLFIFPPILFTFLRIRRTITTSHIDQANREQDEMVSTVERTVTNYRLVADFGQRPRFEERYQNRVSEFNKAGKAATQVLKNNNYFSAWLTVLLVAAYTIMGGMEVIDKDKSKEERLSLGLFLANLSIINTIGASWGDIYKVLMDMQSISPALLVVTKLINLPTDVPPRKSLNRFRRMKTKDLREEVRKTCDKGWPADNLPIILQDLVFTYSTAKGVPMNSDMPSFQMKGQINFHQGVFTALTGPQGEGKSTLLKMIGGVILPEPGALFVPSHLRTLHVGTDVLFFRASLFTNLTFGCIPGDPDGGPERVCRICERLALPQAVMEMIKQGPEGDVLAWGDTLSLAVKGLLGFARAVITNPELMCIHKPIMAYNEETSKLVLDMLKEFCVNKGVEQDPSSRWARRPRTCIITAAKMASVAMADHVYYVSRKGMQHMEKEDLVGKLDVGKLMEAGDSDGSEGSRDFLEIEVTR